MSIPSTLIVTSEQLKTGDIGVNDPVTFAGYFANFPGRIRMEPIVREGVIAMLPEEKFDTTLHKQGRLFLADLHAFHGNSGSPVFVNIGGMHHGMVFASERYFLLGVLSGYYPDLRISAFRRRLFSLAKFATTAGSQQSFRAWSC